MANARRPRPGGPPTVFRTVMAPLLFLLIVEAALLAGSLALSGVVGRLDQNARDMLAQQVQNRENYLENSMVQTWSDLGQLAADVNASAQALLDEGALSLETLSDSSDACAPLLRDVTDELISTMYAKRVSGIFLIFNTQDLTAQHEAGAYLPRSGIYIRDLDPASTPSARNADLLLERAPISVVKSMRISTNTGWQPRFTFDPQDGAGDYGFYYRPFQAAYDAGGAGSASDYGYWTPAPFVLPGTDYAAVSYSIPLILEDGTVYGVLGVDLLTDYLRTLLPYDELFDGGQGTYLLAVSSAEAPLDFTPLLASGGTPRGLAPLSLSAGEKGGYRFSYDGTDYSADVEFLPLYSTNAPFSDQRWALIGAVPTGRFLAFSRQMTSILALALLLMLGAGVLGSFIISRRISAPIRRLSEEVDQAQRARGGIPSLSSTGIREIDRFSGAITALSRDVVNASTRFLRIMEMASVEIGGFELCPRENTVFVTDNYFRLFGMDVELSGLTPEQFQALQAQADRSIIHTDAPGGGRLYRVVPPQGGVRYVRVETVEEGGRQVGLAEDVTAATLERLRIEHERDYDLLTGLLNRRAFYRTAEALFQSPERLGCAVLVMLDLDNLKSINDRFGHDWGDQYIRQAGRCFAGGAPADALCARVSGDEFVLFLYGYPDRAAVRAALGDFTRAIRESRFSLPSGEVSPIRASGGAAWYPGDSRDFHELMKYADFAMYQVKRTVKGSLGDFDLGVYSRESYISQNRAEFAALLERELVDYHFQPIVDAATGGVRAYEALMRVSLPTLHTPEAVLKLAREEGRLQEIERLTWFRSAAAFQSLLDRKLVQPEALLFVNSIASQQMTPEEGAAFHARHGDLQGRMVVEITESEDMDGAATRAKRECPGFSGLFALDDYGSGYNSEKNLLELSPQFIKVDISIIRGIDADPNKQRIVSNIVGYAHERGMSIIAEGLETAAEVRTVLELGVDLLQGYFLARPAAVPGRISPAALEVIRTYWSRST